MLGAGRGSRSPHPEHKPEGIGLCHRAADATRARRGTSVCGDPHGGPNPTFLGRGKARLAEIIGAFMLANYQDEPLVRLIRSNMLIFVIRHRS
jgi:hypothetical protein